MKILVLRNLSLILFALQLSCGDSSLNLASTRADEHMSASWVQVSVYKMPPSEGGFTYRYAFTRDLRLWSRGSADSKTNQLMYSDDFGKSWNFVNVPGRGVGADGTILFIDSEHGWSMDTATIYKTENGGTSWEKIVLPSDSRIVTLNSLEFRDTKHGFIAGSVSRLIDRGMGMVSSGMEILCTNDGGFKWHICYKSEENDTTLRMLTSGSSTIALVDQRTLLVTGDLGATWTQKHLGFPATDMDANPKGVLWATSEDGYLRFSTDLGDSWQVAPVKEMTPVSRLASISFNESGFGVVVGARGKILTTFDSGLSWSQPEGVRLTGDLWTVRVQNSFVSILDENHLYVFRVNDTSAQDL